MNERLPADHDVRERVRTNLDENILVEAAAGTGKTTLLIGRILELIEKKNAVLSRIVAITFTEKAAGELKARLRSKLEEKIREGENRENYRAALHDLDHMPVGTIHGFCADLIRQLPVEAGVDPAFSIADEETEQGLRNEFWSDWITEQLSVDCDAVRPYLDHGVPLQNAQGEGSSLRDLFEYMTRNRDALDKLHVDGSAEATKLTEWMKTGVREFWYKKLDSGYLGFQDLLVVTRDVLKQHDAARRLIRDRYDYLLIDEFQDTDPLQTEIIFLLASTEGQADWERAKLHPGRLFLVGDPKQSIYRFRRADLKLYGRVKKRFTEVGCVETISVNFRSRTAIVEEVNAVFAAAMKGESGESFEPVYTPLFAHREDFGTADVHLLAPPIGYEQQKHGSDVAARLEAAAIAEYILRLIDGNNFKPSDIAILFRTTTHLETLTAELRARDIPFETSNARSFTKRSEVQALRAVLGALDNPANEAEVVGALRSPFFACSDDEILMHRLRGGRFDFLQDRIAVGSLSESFELLRQLFEEKRSLAVSQLILRILERSSSLPIFVLKPQGETRLQNLYRLVSAARRSDKQTGGSLYRFVRWMDSLESLKGQSEADVAEVESEAVHLATIHKAKGLEFPAVFLFRLFQMDSFKENIFHDRDGGEINFKLKDTATPHYQSVHEQEKDRSKEEIARMLYVAMTRAKDLLVLPIHWQSKNSFVREMISARYPTADGIVSVPNLGSARIVNSDDMDLRKPRQEKLRLEIPAIQPVTMDDSGMKKAEWTKRLATAVQRLDHSRRYSSASAQEAEIAIPETKQKLFIHTPSAVFGSAVHKILENIALPEGENLDVLLDEQKRKGFLSDEAVVEAREMIRRALESAFFRETLKQAETIYRELPYAAELDGVIYEGFMDLVLVNGRTAFIIDYKTDQIETGKIAEAAERYRGQARIYAKALQRILGGEPPDVALLFLRTCEVHVFHGRDF